MPQTPKILVFTTSSCPHCVLAKELLKRKGSKFREVDASDPKMRLALMKRAHGRKTVPQIFIGDLHIGGFDDLKALDKEGELDSLLKAVS